MRLRIAENFLLAEVAAGDREYCTYFAMVSPPRSLLQLRGGKRWITIAILAVGICFSIMEDANLLTPYASSVVNLDNNKSPSSRFFFGREMLGLSNLWDPAVTSDSANGNASLLLLEGTIPAALINKLYHETGHSAFSPLSPNFRGFIDPWSTIQQSSDDFVGCVPTSKVQILQVLEQNAWALQTLDQHGTPKHVGGDELHVTFTAPQNNRTTWDPVRKEIIQHPDYICMPTDLRNGTYSLECLEPPLILPEWKQQEQGIQPYTNGSLTIHLTYTCGMGMVTQKSDWKNNTRGALDWMHVFENVPTPPWKTFDPPTVPSITINSTVVNKKLSEYNYVAFFGDSVLGLLTGQYRSNSEFNKYPHPKAPFPPKGKFHFQGNTRRPYVGNVKYLEELLEKWHGDKLRQEPNSAIVLGSGAWDLGILVWGGGDANFTLGPHVDAHREFFTWLLKQYPRTPIFWKSSSAPHPHIVRDLSDLPADVSALVSKGNRYNSIARQEAFEAAIRALIQEEPFRDRIGVLDVFKASRLAADWLFPFNTHHLNWEFNRHMIMEWFY